jgi:hypothetical protein
VIGLGCDNFGIPIDQDQTTPVVHATLDAWITLFDAAGATSPDQIAVLAGAGLCDANGSISCPGTPAGIGVDVP